MINSSSKIDSKTFDIKITLIMNMGTTYTLSSSMKIDSRMLLHHENVMCQMFKFENICDQWAWALKERLKHQY